MAKRLSDKQKEKITIDFINGMSIDSLSLEFNCTKLTIVRNLKKKLGDDKYKKYLEKSSVMARQILKNNLKKVKEKVKEKENQKIEIKSIETNPFHDHLSTNSSEEVSSPGQFIELMPLDHNFDNETHKDISSVPLSQINLPSTVFLIVKKEIELETKYLKDYPEWQFLSNDDLDRKTLEIHFDLKTAKRLCKKDQKVIKVPNTDVFRVVSPILLSRGITRIITDDKLICL